MDSDRNNHQNGNNGQGADDPSANDVLAQQLGTDYADVEPTDRQRLQEELKGQSTEPADELERAEQDDALTDDRDTTDGQLLGRNEFGVRKEEGR